jgi:hypothetical protein
MEFPLMGPTANLYHIGLLSHPPGCPFHFRTNSGSLAILAGNAARFLVDDDSKTEKNQRSWIG